MPFEITFDSPEPMEMQFRNGGGAVNSVNGQTGDVVLDASDVGALPDSYTAPVSSVNTKTGAVVLNAGDIGYSDAATYSSGSVGAEVSDLKSQIGDLSDLDTEDKSSLVAAINEAAQSGGGGGGGTSPSPYTSNPSALGTASPGSSAKYSRGDHVHPMPSASDVGAVPVAQGVAHAGEFVVVGSDGNITTVTMTAWAGGSY